MGSRKWIRHDDLTNREVEILRLLAEGLPNREIAERLVMTTNSVKWFNHQIYGKLGVGSRTQAIAHTRARQLLDQGDGVERPFKAIPHAPKNNLPSEATHFIGRKREIAEIKPLLKTARMLTLVGPPGTGKTRLALQVAREVIGSFQEGVYFVSLAPVADPALLANLIASAIGMSEVPDQPLLETLKHVLRERHLLLVLDNFEHLIQAGRQVSELLSATKQLQVLATSREPLHLYGEQEFVVPPLELPDPEHPDPEALEACESTALFIQRAHAARVDFELTTEHALDIAKICIRLEGLPLAIELAAAHIKLLTPRTLLARLSSRLNTLTGGAQDLPFRQQTLRNTIEWSYHLLDDGEKTLFARLAVFRGGRSLEAIEAVCSQGLPIDVFDGITSLVDKSLIQQKESPDGESRFVMLETIHEYAWERLRANGEARTLCRLHAEYFVHLAELAEPELRQARFSYWIERLEREDNDLSVALEWALSEDGDIELGLRLAAALRDYWVMTGRFVQHEPWLQRALSKADAAPSSLRVRVLTALGLVLFAMNKPALQKRIMEEAVSLARAEGDQINLAWALIFLGGASIGQTSSYEEALAITKEGLSIFRVLEHKPGMAQAFTVIGELARTHGNDDRAQEAYEECLFLVNQTGEVRRKAIMLSNLGFIAMHRSDVKQAERLFRRALLESLELRYDERRIIFHIIQLAGAIAAGGETERAVRLFGAAEALLEPNGIGLEPGDLAEYKRDLAFVRGQLDEATFQVCWNEGRSWSLDQAISNAVPVRVG